MSQPRHAKRGGAHRAVPPPTWAATPPAPDDERVAGRRRYLEAVTDPLPSREPEEPAAPSTAGRPVCQLTPFELSICVPGDPDFQPGEELLEEDFHQWLRFDQAIERDMEIE
jgi:hypothetical protein